MALRAGVFVLLLAVMTAIAAPTFARSADGCVTPAACASIGGEQPVPCATDARCGGATIAAGAVVLLAVAAAAPAIPALLRRRHVARPAMMSPPLLLVQRLLRPPQVTLPS